MKRYREKQNAIEQLYAYKVDHNIPEYERLTHDPYAEIPEIIEPSPRKKPYVDIRGIESTVRDLKHRGKL